MCVLSVFYASFCCRWFWSSLALFKCILLCLMSVSFTIFFLRVFPNTPHTKSTRTNTHTHTHTHSAHPFSCGCWPLRVSGTASRRAAVRRRGSPCAGRRARIAAPCGREGAGAARPFGRPGTSSSRQPARSLHRLRRPQLVQSLGVDVGRAFAGDSRGRKKNGVCTELVRYAHGTKRPQPAAPPLKSSY